MPGASRAADAVTAAASAVELAPTSAECRLALAEALRASFDRAQAIAQYELALRQAPADARILTGLGAALDSVGLTVDAVRCFQEVLALDPSHSLARAALKNAALRRRSEPPAAVLAEVRRLSAEAERLSASGQMLQALAVYGQCARLMPEFAPAYYWMGCAAQDIGRAEAALAYYELACRIQPDLFAAAHNAGKLAANFGLVDRATRHLRTADRLRPQDGIAMRLELVTAAIHESTAQIAESRQRLEQSLDRLLEDPPRITDPLNKAEPPTFYLAYHGICNRDLHTKLARVFVRAAPELAWIAPHCREPRRPAGRIKVGFISQHMRGHSIGKTTRGLIARLSRERFEVYALNIPPVLVDDTARWIQARADHWLTVEDELHRARSQVAALQLDVLFYQDIGMEPFSYFLAFSRLAPVQCVSFGHPDTSGIPSIDYFVSNDLYEPHDAAQHYSERLFQLRDLPTLAYYYRPERRTPAMTREQLGLRDREHLYLCPQTLFKLHPDFDRLLSGILERDSLGRVLLIAGHCAEWNLQLRQRFMRYMPRLAERILFLPRLNYAAFLQLLGVADVMLDTIHFNGMNTSLEAFAVGTPVVTLPKSLQRGRHTRAMYLKMGIEACIAADEDAYVDSAVGLAVDRDRRRTMHELIMRRSEVLFEDQRVVTEFERFFATVTDR
jgi:protein O-GlcNAc transferase